MRLFYTLGIFLYGSLIRLAALFSDKARAWVNGRRTEANWQIYPQPGQRVVWFHCASLGEFEQARPLIEGLRERANPPYLVLSFFSPSGYTVRKNYEQVDLVCYLPLDLPGKVRQFLDKLRPDLVFFVKYEFWFNFLRALHQRQIPLLLVSGIFRKNQLFFHPFGGYFKKQLRAFQHFFLQDQPSANLLRQQGFEQYTVTGDTRLDRVLHIIQEAPTYPILEVFRQRANTNGKQLIVAGSTWPQDEALLAEVMQARPDAYAWIIAPHELHPSHIQSLQALLPLPQARYTALSSADDLPGETSVLILDTIGMLAYVYQYADLCYVGGAFGKGLHNILEPVAHQKAVLFGPKYQKFQEARDLVQTPAAHQINTAADFIQVATTCSNNQTAIKEAIQAYLQTQRGATNAILRFLENNGF